MPPQALIFNLDCLLPGARARYRALESASDPGAARPLFTDDAPASLQRLPGADEKLREWQARFALAVVTPMPLKPAGECIKWADWRGMFRVFVGREHVDGAWPDPRWYAQAVKRLQLPAEACVVFESTAGGVGAARRAGVATCGVFGSGDSRRSLLAAGACALVRDFNDPFLENGPLQGRWPGLFRRWLQALRSR